MAERQGSRGRNRHEDGGKKEQRTKGKKRSSEMSQSFTLSVNPAQHCEMSELDELGIVLLPSIAGHQVSIVPKCPLV